MCCARYKEKEDPDPGGTHRSALLLDEWLIEVDGVRRLQLVVPLVRVPRPAEVECDSRSGTQYQEGEPAQQVHSKNATQKTKAQQTTN